MKTWGDGKGVHDYVVSVQQSPPALPPPSLSLHLLAFWYIVLTYLCLSINFGENTPQIKKRKSHCCLWWCCCCCCGCSLWANLPYRIKRNPPLLYCLLIMLLDPPKTTRKSLLDNKHAQAQEATQQSSKFFVHFVQWLRSF